MNEALKPCPFCGTGPSDDDNIPSVALYTNFGTCDSFVWCENCGAEGPSRATPKTTTDAWNTRYNGDQASNLIKEAITHYWGERCADYTSNCPTCQAWAEFDRMNGGDDDRSK